MLKEVFTDVRYRTDFLAAEGNNKHHEALRESD
jgi:hypothetical protein